MVDGSDNPVKEWLNSPIPERLWHYTSIQGFCGITSSKNIFATDIRFLNDSSEFIHARTHGNVPSLVASNWYDDGPQDLGNWFPCLDESSSLPLP